MYASDLTNRKRAQVVFSDVSRQKALFNQGSIMRINYQKGGTDYSYMMELEQGCINNKCVGLIIARAADGNYITDMNIDAATYINPATLIEYGYPIYVDASGNSITVETASPLAYKITSPTGVILFSGLPSLPAYSYLTTDDVYYPIPMGSMEFQFFNQTYNASRPMYWSTNCAILFEDPGARRITFQKDTCPAILLGNGDRRLDRLYIRDNSISGKYSIITLFVFYEDFSATISTPNTGEYRIRIIKELTGTKRQWIEVSVAISPPFSGYIAGDRDTDNIITDSTKLSPYNITDGNNFLNPCGTTFARVGPAPGTSFTFESDMQGLSWIFRNNTYVST
jgi:hypothetical protein